MLMKFKDIQIAATGATNASGPANIIKSLTAFVIAVEFVNQRDEVFHGSKISQEKDVAG